MSTNAELEIAGSYKDENKVTQKFTAGYTGYSEDAEGLDLIIEDYGAKQIVEAINKDRSTTAVNAERQRLTAGVREANTNKASIVDELKAAETPEEREAILAKHGLA